MRIFFDVDYTILGGQNRLRPGTKETWERLVADGHEIHVWSGEGRRYEVLKDHGLEHLVSGVYWKPRYDYIRRLDRLGVDVIPDFIIDDYPEICTIFGGFYCREFYRDPDDEMEQIYQTISEWVRDGTSEHKRFRARHPDFDGMLARAAAEREEEAAKQAASES
jgi:hypothetical protein